MKAAATDRKQPRDRPDRGDRRPERVARERRSGEGSESALASLKSIELDRQKIRPPADDGNRA